MRRLVVSLTITLVAVWLAVPGALARDLTFEERVKAQEAIERVYYSHQSGATKPFEEAVPKAVLENKVRTYLKQSVALERHWRTPVTAEMLRRELERMASGTRMPERLVELYTALGNDSFLIEECLARATLVDRLTRNFYAFDPALHVEARRRAEELHRQLSSGELSPTMDHPHRAVVEFEIGKWEPAASDAERRANPSGNREAPRQRRLSPDEFRKARALLPGVTGQVSTPKETRDAFALSVVLSETTGQVRAASYTIAKTSWDTWWAAQRNLLSDSIPTVATDRDPLPHPTAGPAAGGLPCVPDDTWDNGSLDDLPDPADRRTAVWTGSVMVVWGGWDGVSPPFNTGGRYDPATDSWAPTSTIGAPSGRVSHTAVWTGSQMVVWGGDRNGYLDTGGRYDPATDTWTPTSTTGAPSGRAGHTAVWTGSVMVVWGGMDTTYPGPSHYLNTGGRYDPVTDSWAPISTTGAPSGRYGHSVVWTGSLVVVWGGHAGAASYENTGGRYDPATDTWTPTPTTGAPSGRAGHTAVWTGSVMVVWGGSDTTYPGPSHYLNTGGRYDPVTDGWAPISTTGAPSARESHTAIWTGSLMVVWGGYGEGTFNPYFLSTGGRYDPVTDTWSPTSTSGAASVRRDHTAVWTGNLMIVWGGYDNRYLNTGGRYDPATDSWTPTSSAGGPSVGWDSTAVWTGNLMIVWGSDYLNTGGRYDPAIDNWTPTSTTGAPSARASYTAVWTGSLMVVWGGHGYGYGDTDLDTGGRYDPATDRWTPTSTTGAPSARFAHTAVWTGSLMVVWGGYFEDNASNYLRLNTGGRYDPETDSWTPTSTTGAPSARVSHTAVWTGSLVAVWGGYAGAASYENTGGRYDPTTDSWTPTSTMGAPSARAYHSAVWTGSLMVVWGGGYDPYPNTGGRYDPATDSWTPTSTTGAPSGRYAHTAVWTGSVMVVWDGYAANDDRGGRYDPATDSWTPMSTTGAPSARAYHSAVWTGSVMLIWGGLGAGFLNNGGRYVLGASVDNDGDGSSECQGDCNDGNPDVHQGAAEICNGIDDDCDGTIDDGVEQTFYRDQDGDGYGDPAVAQQACTAPPGYVPNNQDCVDANAQVKPGATEACNAVNDDCDGTTPDGSGEFWLGQPCDGESDADACNGGVFSCVSGAKSCGDTAESDDLCVEFDVNGDALIDVVELSWWARALGACSPEPASEWWGPVDYDRNGCIEGPDLSILGSNGVWGKTTDRCSYGCP